MFVQNIHISLVYLIRNCNNQEVESRNLGEGFHCKALPLTKWVYALWIIRYILGKSNVKIKNLCIPYSKSQLNVLFAQFMSLLLKKVKIETYFFIQLKRQTFYIINQRYCPPLTIFTTFVGFPSSPPHSILIFSIKL